VSLDLLSRLCNSARGLFRDLAEGRFLSTTCCHKGWVSVRVGKNLRNQPSRRSFYLMLRLIYLVNGQRCVLIGRNLRLSPRASGGLKRRGRGGSLRWRRLESFGSKWGLSGLSSQSGSQVKGQYKRAAGPRCARETFAAPKMSVFSSGLGSIEPCGGGEQVAPHGLDLKVSNCPLAIAFNLSAQRLWGFELLFGAQPM
jgi:hypothetical protein